MDGQTGDSTCLVWQPIRSSTPGHLVRGTSARIVYRETVVPPVTSGGSSNPQQPSPQRIVKKFSPNKAIGKPEAVLHLQTGDKIFCEAISIDEKGFTFKSKFSESTFVAHTQIHALELLPQVGSASIDVKKKNAC